MVKWLPLSSNPSQSFSKRGTSPPNLKRHCKHWYFRQTLHRNVHRPWQGRPHPSFVKYVAVVTNKRSSFLTCFCYIQYTVHFISSPQYLQTIHSWTLFSCTHMSDCYSRFMQRWLRSLNLKRGVKWRSDDMHKLKYQLTLTCTVKSWLIPVTYTP